MTIRPLLPAFCLLFSIGYPMMANAAPLSLVSGDEYRQEKAFDATHTTNGLAPKWAPAPGAPEIDIRKPDLDSPVSSPFPIKIVFKTFDGAQIDLSSFHVYYGFLKLDITNRILKRVKPSQDGLVVDQASIPAGTHHLTLRVMDTKGREAERDVALQVQ